MRSSVISASARTPYNPPIVYLDVCLLDSVPSCAIGVLSEQSIHAFVDGECLPDLVEFSSEQPLGGNWQNSLNGLWKIHHCRIV